MTKIEIRKDGRDMAYHAYVNGVILRTKAGIGRRFKTEKAARKAAEKAES